MAKIPIFQDSIILDSLIDTQLDETIYKVLKNEMEKKDGSFFSNKGGYQTVSINNEKICNTILNKSVKMITENYRIFNSNFTMNALWINQNKKGNYNSPHIHPLSVFAGVYYLNVAETGGDLIFFRSDRSNQMLDINKDLIDEDFNAEYHLRPLKNQIILFPSNLIHMVSAHFEDKPRISISFNILIGKNG